MARFPFKDFQELASEELKIVVGPSGVFWIVPTSG
jgi:hypothetical protein